MSPLYKTNNPGTGPTRELSLRVSVATLVRVLFSHPQHGSLMLAFEHKATWLSDDAFPKVTLQVQPFGGAIRFRKLNPLLDTIGRFNFDSDRSREENDFRIFIRPEDWPEVKAFCLDELNDPIDGALESEPSRELREEFRDALGIELSRHDYSLRGLETVIENIPVRTENVHAFGSESVRIYRTFEASIEDPVLANLLINNAIRNGPDELRKIAQDDLKSGGWGRANGVFTAELESLRQFYLAVLPEHRSLVHTFNGANLVGNVPVILDNVNVPNYRHIKD
jgi:hypothetical protein